MAQRCCFKLQKTSHLLISKYGKNDSTADMANWGSVLLLLQFTSTVGASIENGANWYNMPSEGLGLG